MRLPAPADINGDALAAEIGLAVGLTVAVQLIGDEIEVRAEDDAPLDRTKVEQAVSAHVPPPPPADPEAEFRKALEAAMTVTQIRDALLGKTGPGAEPRRPDGR